MRPDSTDPPRIPGIPLWWGECRALTDAEAVNGEQSLAAHHALDGVVRGAVANDDERDAIPDPDGWLGECAG